MAVQMNQMFLRAYVTLSVFYLGSVGSIKVTFGTSGGPIVPPTPFPPIPAPRPPYRIPAAVWEDQTGDLPNPNPYKPPVLPNLAHIFGNKLSTTQQPPLTVRPPNNHRYTYVAYTPRKPVVQPLASTLSPIKSFVNAYAQATKSTSTQPKIDAKENTNSHQSEDNNYQNIDNSRHTFASYNIVPELAIKYIPGYGFKYITPEQDKDPRKYEKSSKYFHDKYNTLETNNIFSNYDHPHDADLSYDKYITQRVKKSPEQQVYVPQQTFSYYHQPQLFFPVNYARH
ncbi:nuclear protein GV1 [Arctopsyche grandis]|uniref:nuclear protein GV1 n=1 Tax=Arctopsyche grandis TaxID=121162 RepID=UPI00406D8F4B